MTMSVSGIVDEPSKMNGEIQTANGEKKVGHGEDELVAEIRRNVEVIDMAVSTKDTRLQSRILRQTKLLRKRLTTSALGKAVEKCMTPDQLGYHSMVKYLKLNGNGMEIEKPMMTTGVAAAPGEAAEGDGTGADMTSVSPTTGLTSVPEISAYLQLLTVAHLIDIKRHQDAVEAATSLVDFLSLYNRRTLDDFSSRAFFFYSRANELTDTLAVIRPRLLSAYRTACLRHDHSGQAVLLNLLLRNYIHYNLYDQADKLVTKTQFPESRSNNQLARYLYYLGRIKAIQLDYSEAFQCLQQAQRKAPQGSALAFRIVVQKFIFIVQLLTGEIPDRAAFRQSKMKKALFPYLCLTKSVRVGDLTEFKKVTETYAATFKADNTMTLITRLRQNVIKTGLRKINTSYSRISLEDICHRLGLDSKEDAEGVVAKAIRDGVIDAVIDHKAGAVQSKEEVNTYATIEPTNAYHSRVEFCLNIYSEAIRAMRFPDATEDDANAEARRERLKEEQELAKTLEEDEDDLDEEY